MAAKQTLNPELVAIADYVSTSREGKLTIAGIFDRFFVSKLPTRWLSMTFVAVFTGKSDTEHEIQLEVVAPSKKKLIEKGMKVKISPSGKANFITRFQNFPIEEFGEHSIVVKEGKKEIARTKYLVHQRATTEPEGLVS